MEPRSDDRQKQQSIGYLLPFVYNLNFFFSFSITQALGLLINLTEHSKQNIEILNTAFGPACYESQESSSIDDHVSPVESLTQLFLVRNEASKEGDLMEELERLEKEQGQLINTVYLCNCKQRFRESANISGGE